MFKSNRPIFDRALQILAWFVFGFCSVVIVTGMLVGQTGTSVAQEQDPAAAEEVAEEGVEVADAEEAEPSVEEAVPEGEEVPEAEAPAESQEEAGEPGQRGPPEASEEAPPEPETTSLRRVDRESSSSIFEKMISFLGIFALLGVALLLSNNRRKVNWKLVAVGVGLQLGFAILIFYVPGGEAVFEFATVAVKKLLEFTAVGSDFIFASFVTGEWDISLINFAFAVLPTIIFFSALMTILYHLGIMQRLVHVFAWSMQKVMNISGAESMSAAANIFVGQTEAPVVIRPYLAGLTMSELMAVMAGGFA
ncbi:MAG: Na+ dependent nucleoside transporter N-terminal domain-containing protein, partial [Bradymonadaceae bacterium]